MRRYCIAGNWKMNHALAETRAFLSDLSAKLSSPLPVDVMLFPPFVNLESAATSRGNAPIFLGAQTLSEHAKGAFTGEISGPMLNAVGCTHVLVGHSERRQLFSETDSLLNLKLKAALTCGLIPILCVGETLAERQSDQTLLIIRRQLEAGLSGVGSDRPFLIAYEPVWAIGTGQVATPDQAQAVHLDIRQTLNRLGYPAQTIQVLYGGSVTEDNCDELLSQPDIDGALIGGASLDQDRFYAIVEKTLALSTIR
jgi:triosephosphate isomerase